jgi:hypothetical protein
MSKVSSFGWGKGTCTLDFGLLGMFIDILFLATILANKIQTLANQKDFPRYTLPDESRDQVLDNRIPSLPRGARRRTRRTRCPRLAIVVGGDLPNEKLLEGITELSLVYPVTQHFVPRPRNLREKFVRKRADIRVTMSGERMHFIYQRAALQP